MKRRYWILAAAVAAVAGLSVISGYLDPELGDERRWGGLALVVAGVAVAVPAVLRLASDWSRMKPQHNVDLAFIQIGLGLALLTVAFMLGGRFGVFLSPLAKESEQTPPPAAGPREAGKNQDS